MKSIFILLCLVSALYCDKITDGSQDSRRHSHSGQSEDQTIPIIKTKEEIDAMKAANEQAETIFNSKKEGRDDPDGVHIEAQLVVKQVPSDSMPNQVGEIDQNPKIKTVRINKFTICVSDKDVGLLSS